MLRGAEGTRYDPAFLFYRILDDSTTFNVGELVESMSTGYAKHAAAATASLGVIIAFFDGSMAPLRPEDVAKGPVAFAGDVSQVATAADNTTNIRKMALVCGDPSVLWSADVNGTIGTTNASNLPSAGIDIDSAGTNYGRVLESTVTRTPADITNFVTQGVDTNDPTRLMVQLSCSEIFSSARG